MRHYGILFMDGQFNKTWTLPSQGKIKARKLMSFPYPEEFTSSVDFEIQRNKGVMEELNKHDCPCGFVFFLTCVQCDGNGTLGQEEKSGGHIEQIECSNCYGTGMKPEKLEEFQNIKNEDEAEDYYHEHGGIIKVNAEQLNRWGKS